MIQGLTSLAALRHGEEENKLYFYAVINGASPSGSLKDIYSYYNVKNCASLFESTIYQGSEQVGPWLLELDTTNLNPDYPYTEDWGIYLCHEIDFQQLFRLLQSFLTAETDNQTVLIRWWDPRILFLLLQDLDIESPFAKALGLALIYFQQNWFIKSNTIAKNDVITQPQATKWMLKAHHFNSYRRSDYYIPQLAIAISENWLRYDQEKWRTLNNANQPLNVQLIPIITSVKQQGVHEYQHIEQFCHFAITHHKSPDWLLSKKTDSPQSWLANLSKDLT